MQVDDLNFLQFVQSFRRGDPLSDCDIKLSELMQAIANTGKGGKFNLSFDFRVAKGGHLEITASPTIKKPSQPIPPGIYFVSDDSGLARRDPRQMDIEDAINRRRAMEP